MQDVWKVGTLVVCLACLGWMGCSEPVAQVTGEVTVGGEPVTGGSVILQPLEEGKKPAAGNLDTSGKFTLLTSGGQPLAPGDYRVIYSPPDAFEPGSAPDARKWKGLRGPQDPVTVDVGQNHVKIELVK